MASLPEPFAYHLCSHLEDRNTDRARPGKTVEAEEFLISLPVVSDIGHQDDADRTVVLCVDGFVDGAPVGGVLATGEDASLVVLLRLVVDDDGDFPPGVEMLIVIVVVFRGGDAVADKNQGSFNRGVGGETQGAEVGVEFEGAGPFSGFSDQRIVLSHLGGDRDVKSL